MAATSLARRAAQAMIGSTFVALGYDAFTKPGGRVALAGKTLATIRTVLPMPDDDEVLVRTNAAVQTVGGALMCLGILPRVSAAAIAASLIPTTAAGHPFWSIDDPHERKAQRVQFHKNVALAGGLILVVLRRRRRPDTHGAARTDG